MQFRNLEQEVLTAGQLLADDDGFRIGHRNRVPERLPAEVRVDEGRHDAQFGEAQPHARVLAPGFHQQRDGVPAGEALGPEVARNAIGQATNLVKGEPLVVHQQGHFGRVARGHLLEPPHDGHLALLVPVQDQAEAEKHPGGTAKGRGRTRRRTIFN